MRLRAKLMIALNSRYPAYPQNAASILVFSNKRSLRDRGRSLYTTSSDFYTYAASRRACFAFSSQLWAHSNTAQLDHPTSAAPHYSLPRKHRNQPHKKREISPNGVSPMSPVAKSWGHTYAKSRRLLYIPGSITHAPNHTYFVTLDLLVRRL